jgi:hypothetical protein
MARSSRTLIAVLVAIGLGMPQLANAQGRTAPPGSSSSGTATERPASSSGGSSGGSSVGTAGSGGSNGGSSNAGGSTPDGRTGTQPIASRDRGGRPVVGTAGSRMLGTVTGLPGPTFGPWGRYFPWYSTGFGWDYGFVQFNPYFGSADFLVGPWYDPLYYDPFNPFGYGYSAFQYGRPYGTALDRGRSAPEPITHVTGSIRLKVSPGTAQVYIDGVLAGAAREFDGLFSHHLVLDSGPHQLELRADGCETYHETISVDAGKTLTERLSLKKTQ